MGGAPSVGIARVEERGPGPFRRTELRSLLACAPEDMQATLAARIRECAMLAMVAAVQLTLRL